MNIKIITGPKHAGKTTTLLNLPEIHDFGGFLTPVIEGKRYFRLLPDGEQFPMEAEADEETLTIGRFRFSRNSFDKAVNHTLESQAKKIIIDEAGPLELRGEGFSDLIRTLLLKPRDEIWIVVRQELVEEMITYFDLPRQTIIIPFSDIKH